MQIKIKETEESIEINSNDKESVKKGMEFIEQNYRRDLEITMSQYNPHINEDSHDEFIIFDNLNFLEELNKKDDKGDIIFKYKSGSSEISLDKIIQDEKFLEMITNEIKNKGFSPLEQLIAVYDIVQAIKPYVKSEKSDDSRTLYEYLNNGYMVCTGYSNLITNLGYRLGQNYSCISCITKREGHQRNYVNLIDDKYDIDGFYALDATWDESYGHEAEERNYKNFLMTTEKGRNNILTNKSSYNYDEFFSITDIDDFFNHIMSVEDYDVLPEEVKTINFEPNKEYFRKKWNYVLMAEQLRYLDPEFFEKFKMLDLKKAEDVQIVLDYFKRKIDKPIDKNRLIEAKMVVERSKYKNLTEQDFKDMQVGISQKFNGGIYGKGFEEYLEKRYEDIKDLTLEEASKENPFFRCKNVLAKYLREALVDDKMCTAFDGIEKEIKGIDAQYIEIILGKEDELISAGYNIDKEPAFLEYTEEEVLEAGEKRTLNISLPEVDESLSIKSQIEVLREYRNNLYRIIGIEEKDRKSISFQDIGKEVLKELEAVEERQQVNKSLENDKNILIELRNKDSKDI